MSPDDSRHGASKRPPINRTLIDCRCCGRQRENRGRGLCGACYTREAYHGRINDWPRDVGAANGYVDEVLVERILSGDGSLAREANSSERTEVARRWVTSGRSTTELARLTGWKVERYYRVGDQREKKEAA